MYLETKLCIFHRGLRAVVIVLIINCASLAGLPILTFASLHRYQQTALEEILLWQVRLNCYFFILLLTLLVSKYCYPQNTQEMLPLFLVSGIVGVSLEWSVLGQLIVHLKPRESGGSWLALDLRVLGLSPSVRCRDYIRACIHTYIGT